MQKLTRQQGEIVEKVLTRYNGDKAKAAMNYVPSKVLNAEQFVRCMIEGWEVEYSKEDKLLFFYNSYKGKQGPTRYAIRMALQILDIHVEGISNDNGSED